MSFLKIGEKIAKFGKRGKPLRNLRARVDTVEMRMREDGTHPLLSACIALARLKYHLVRTGMCLSVRANWAICNGVRLWPVNANLCSPCVRDNRM